jgi:hypothetical protein
MMFMKITSRLMKLGSSEYYLHDDLPVHLFGMSSPLH